MKLESGRLALVASAVIIVGLFIGGIPQRSAAQANQQRPDKPKLQKPQQPPPDEASSQKDDAPIRLGTDLVVLDVSVVDPSSNKAIMDLKQDDFIVTEDRVQQKIDHFSREQVPVSLVLTIDTSGSMRPKLDTVIKASVNLVKDSSPLDEIALIEFNEEISLLEEFTSNTGDVVDTLQGLIARSVTKMLDALYLAAGYASKEGKNRRKAVIIVTDGDERDSEYRVSDVIDHLRETDVQLYLIGFTQGLDSESAIFRKSRKQKSEELLAKLAEETGGKAFFPKELSEVHAIAQQISIDLRTQYSISYYPTNSKKDGSFRTVRVQVNSGNRRLVARTRNGYTAPREGEQRSTSK